MIKTTLLPNNPPSSFPDTLFKHLSIFFFSFFIISYFWLSSPSYTTPLNTMPSRGIRLMTWLIKIWNVFPSDWQRGGRVGVGCCCLLFIAVSLPSVTVKRIPVRGEDENEGVLRKRSRSVQMFCHISLFNNSSNRWLQRLNSPFFPKESHQVLEV